MYLRRMILLLLAVNPTQPMAPELQPVESQTPERQKRTLVYTFNSATGILFALSVPLLITGRNIFVAYNFEMNYNMPTDSTDFTQGVLKKGDTNEIEGGVASRRSREANSVGEGRPVRPRPSITRKKLYRSIELNLTRYGYDGKKCILRMICELASWPAREANGVLGDMLQLIFTPSSSRHENLPNEFYFAEELGSQRNCSKYWKRCPRDPLDSISLLL